MTERKVAIVREFGTHKKETFCLLAHENNAFEKNETGNFCAVYLLNKSSIGFQTCILVCKNYHVFQCGG